MRLHLTFKKNLNVVMYSIVSVLCLALLIQQSNAQLANGQSKFLGNIIPGSAPSNFNTYWNQVTPENGGKWGTIQGGGQNSWNWSEADVSYNYAQSHGYKFKWHTLVWGAQQPSWVNSSNVQSALQTFMTNVKNRYTNIWAIDVVNEPLAGHNPPSYASGLGGAGSTGWDWVITAFQMARNTFPSSVKLLINEYGTENDANARNTYKTIINLLKSRGLIDGIGLQSHFFNLDNMSASQMTTCLNDYATLGLDIYISELDIKGGGTESGQSAKYQELFPVMWNHASVKGITLWGYIEGQTWSSGTGILRSNNTEKPAMTWLKSFMAGSGCNPTAITPYIQIDNGSWQQTSTASVSVGAAVKFGPQPVSGGSWSWSGPNGFSASTREVTISNIQTNQAGTYTAQYTNSCGAQSTQAFNVTVGGGGGSNTIVVRARGTNGSENIRVTVSGSQIGAWTLSTSYQNYTASTNNTGAINVEFTNDASGRDVQVDYITVNGSTRQAENQSTNTGVWNGSGCGGSNSEWLHCNGYIGFGNVSGGGGSNTVIVRARGTNGSESIELRVNNNAIATWTLTTSMANYTATTSTTGAIQVQFTNDNGTQRDVQVDYIQVNGSTRQAENQSTNTGVWNGSSCGGSNSEWLHCNGYIAFGNLPKSSAEAEIAQLENFFLGQNYPNPFNPSTVIQFGIPENSYVSLKVYNSLGEEIAELAGREYSAGWHSVSFDASNLSSGVYFYALRAGKFSTSKKMLLQK